MTTGDDPLQLAEATARVLRSRVAAGPLWVDVSGDSMQPALPARARVLLAPASKPRRGQVWAFVDEDRLVVVHRYLRRRPGGSLVFRGDAVGYEDPSVQPNQLVGRVVRAEIDGRPADVPDRLRPVARSYAGAARRRVSALLRTGR
jgi:phage repressor protein C with HTH and peptisase S24 domain